MQSHRHLPWARRTDRRGRPRLISNDRGPFSAGSAQSHTAPPRLRGLTLRPLTSYFYPVQHATMFTNRGRVKVYAPVMIPHQSCSITTLQQSTIHKKSGLWPEIDDNEEWGIWVGSTCTRQGRHALAIGRGLSRPIDISRLLDEVAVGFAKRADMKCFIRSVTQEYQMQPG